jgi:hypothetical protein
MENSTPHTTRAASCFVPVYQRHFAAAENRSKAPAGGIGRKRPAVHGNVRHA